MRNLTKDELLLIAGGAGTGDTGSDAFQMDTIEVTADPNDYADASIDVPVYDTNDLQVADIQIPLEEYGAEIDTNGAITISPAVASAIGAAVAAACSKSTKGVLTGVACSEAGQLVANTLSGLSLGPLPSANPSTYLHVYP